MFPRANVPQSHCTPEPVYPRANVPQNQCTPEPMYPRANVPQSKCTPEPMYPRANVPQSKCTPEQMYPRANVQKIITNSQNQNLKESQISNNPNLRNINHPESQSPRIQISQNQNITGISISQGCKSPMLATCAFETLHQCRHLKRAATKLKSEGVLTCYSALRAASHSVRAPALATKWHHE